MKQKKKIEKWTRRVLAREEGNDGVDYEIIVKKLDGDIDAKLIARGGHWTKAFRDKTIATLSFDGNQGTVKLILQKPTKLKQEFKLDISDLCDLRALIHGTMFTEEGRWQTTMPLDLRMKPVAKRKKK